MVGTGYILVLVILVGYTSSAPLPQKVSTDSLPQGESTTVSVPLPWTLKEVQAEVDDDENDNDENDEEREPKIFGGWLSQNLPLAVANNEIVSSFLNAFGADEASEWEYAGRQGTEYWGTINQRCLGSAQSPINLDSTLVSRSSGSRIELEGYDKFTEDNTKLENNGHTVELKVTNSPSSARMSGGHLESEYQMAQLHFHWAAVDTVGSEHTIDRVPFPLEMHLVHLSRTIDRYKQGGLAVAGFFFQISSDDNPAIEPIIERIGKIKKAKKGTRLRSTFNLESLIEPSLSGPYYSYEGSLTTPGCDEVVEWNLFKKPLDISEEQLAKFRTVEDAMGKAIKFNFRPVQSLNDRKIQYFKE